MKEFSDLHKLTDKHVHVQLNNSTQTIEGHCFCVDPVTKSVVVISVKESSGGEHNEGEHKYTPHIILSHAITHIEERNESSFGDDANFVEYRRNFVATLLGDQTSSNAVSADTLKHRRERLCAWLEENRFTVNRVTGSEGSEELSLINGTVVIEPPYTVDSCRSTNTIVLGRIMKIVKACPQS